MIKFSRSVVTPCAVILFLIAAAAQNGAAQDVLHRVEVFAEGGVSMTNQVTLVEPFAITIPPPPSLPQVVTLTARGSLRTTGRLFAGVRLWLDGSQAIEASYSYSPSDLLVSGSEVGPPLVGAQTFTSTDSLRASFFAGNYVHTLPRVAHLRPFLTAGAGGVSFYSGFADAISHDPFAANLGGGFDLSVSHHWTVRAEYRDWIFDMPQVHQQGPSGLTHNSVASAGIAFRF
jgi:hypothetical protein